MEGMATEQPLERRCAAVTRNGGHCEKWPLKGSSRCRFHGGASTGARDVSKLENNGNAEKHSAYSDPWKLYERLEGEALEWVEEHARKLRVSAGFEAPADSEGETLVEVLSGEAERERRRKAARERAGLGPEQSLEEETLEIALLTYTEWGAIDDTFKREVWTDEQGRRVSPTFEQMMRLSGDIRKRLNALGLYD